MYTLHIFKSLNKTIRYVINIQPQDQSTSATLISVSKISRSRYQLYVQVDRFSKEQGIPCFLSNHSLSLHFINIFLLYFLHKIHYDDAINIAYENDYVIFVLFCTA